MPAMTKREFDTYTSNLRELGPAGEYAASTISFTERDTVENITSNAVSGLVSYLTTSGEKESPYAELGNLITKHKNQKLEQLLNSIYDEFIVPNFGNKITKEAFIDALQTSPELKESFKKCKSSILGAVKEGIKRFAALVGSILCFGGGLIACAEGLSGQLYIAPDLFNTGFELLGRAIFGNLDSDFKNARNKDKLILNVLATATKLAVESVPAAKGLVEEVDRIKGHIAAKNFSNTFGSTIASARPQSKGTGPARRY
jgi:hypothetical protein